MSLLPKGYYRSRGVCIRTSWHSCMGEVVSEFPGICSLSLGRTDGDPGGSSLEVSLLPCQRVTAPFNCEENLIPLSMPWASQLRAAGPAREDLCLALTPQGICSIWSANLEVPANESWPLLFVSWRVSNPGCWWRRYWIQTDGFADIGTFERMNGHLYPGDFPRGSVVKNPPAMQETSFWSLGWKDLLEKEMQLTPVLLPGKAHCMGSQKSWTQQGD